MFEMPTWAGPGPQMTILLQGISPGVLRFTLGQSKAIILNISDAYGCRLRLRSFLTACRKEAEASSSPGGAYRSEGTASSNRLAASRDHERP